MRLRLIVCILLFCSACLFPACGSDSGEPVEAYFVRDGLAVENLAGARWRLSKNGMPLLESAGNALPQGATSLPSGKIMIGLKWKPGDKYILHTEGSHLELSAPPKPSPLLVTAIDLEHQRPHGGSMGHSPDTEVRFSPGGGRLAVGTITGRLIMAEIPSGRKLWTRKLAEGMVKRLAWGNLGDKKVLYVGEQSPQGLVYCLDAQDGTELWRFDISTKLGRGSVSGDRKHAVYNLPGIYYLRVMPGGDVLVVGTHGRFVGDKYRHDCLIWRLDGKDGQMKWRWPGQGIFPYGITWVGAAKDGNTLAFISFNTFGPKVPGPHLEGTVYCLDGHSGKGRWHYTVPPLKPYYNRVGSWQGLSVSPNGKQVFVGLNDGRVMLFDAANGSQGPLWTVPVGAPVMVGSIPVAAPVSYTRAGGEMLYLVTPGTTIPSGAKAGRRTPQPHPHARHIFAYDLKGKLVWQHRTQGAAQGITDSADGRLVATCVGASSESDDRNRFGLSLFDASLKNGPNPLIYHFATEGPAFFQFDITADGKYLALTESPYTRDEGKTVHGSYRVLVVH
jgi:outer membrane protein assembly factor BamB